MISNLKYSALSQFVFNIEGRLRSGSLWIVGCHIAVHQLKAIGVFLKVSLICDSLLMACIWLNGEFRIWILSFLVARRMLSSKVVDNVVCLTE